MTPNSSPQPNGRSSPRLGIVVLIATVLFASLALTLAVVVLDNALNGRPRDRTIFGILLMAIGFLLGPIVAVLALLRRRSLGRSSWGSLALFPGSFLVLWGIGFLLYAVAAPVSQPIIPYTPTVMIRFDPEGRPQCNTHGWYSGGLEQNGPGESRSNGVLVDGAYYFYFRVFPDESGKRAVTFTGELICEKGKRVELRGELVLTLNFWFQIEGPPGAVLIIDDQPREFPILLKAGTHRVVVRGIAAE